MNQLQTNTLLDGPDEPVVNEQEQDKEVNLQDEEFISNNKAKGYSEGNKNDSVAEDTSLVKDHDLENLPGTEPDPEKPAALDSELE